MTPEALQAAFAVLAWMLVLLAVLAFVQGAAVVAVAVWRWWRS